MAQLLPVLQAFCASPRPFMTDRTPAKLAFKDGLG